MSAFGVLAREAVVDAARRRIVAAVVVVSLLSLLMVESCTQCSTAQVLVEGEVRDLVNVAGFTGSATFLVLALWCVVLAGVLASDHLVETLEDGSAALCLARPVGRGSFAAARLTGALGVAWITAAVLLGATAFLLRARGQLPLAPAALAGLATAAGTLVVGALAMTTSLFLPRLAVVLLVFVSVAGVALANATGMVRAVASPDADLGLLGLVDRFGPPLATSLALALAPWLPNVSVPGDPVAVAVRLAGWALVSLALLVFAFRRIELGR